MEDEFQWETTLDESRPSMEVYLRWMMTFDRRPPLMINDMK